MRHTRILMWAVAAVGGLVVSACASDAEALSKPEFVEQANAICQASQDEADPLFEAIYADMDDDFDQEGPTEELYVRFAEAMGEMMPIFNRQLDEISALEPPPEDKEFIENLIADQAHAITEFVRILDDAAGGDEAARARMDNDEVDPFIDVDRRAREYGLTVCGENG
jgi:hypothetical protein